jgi:hypothetical protein
LFSEGRLLPLARLALEKTLLKKGWQSMHRIGFRSAMLTTALGLAVTANT